MAALSLLLLFGALLAPSTARPLSANTSAAPSVVEVRLGVLLPHRNLDYPWAWPRVAPALSLALEALEPQLRHAGLALRTTVAFASTENEDDGACDATVALAKAAELKHSYDPDVLLGPGCPITRELVLVAHHWGLPLLRAGFYEWRRLFNSTTVYAGPVGPDRRAFEAQLLQHFNLTSRPILVFGPEIGWRDFSPLFSSLLNFQDPPWVTPTSSPRFHQYEEPGDEAVRFIQANGRVVFILGSLEMLQEIMRLAQTQNMTNGDYVFFYLDLLGDSLRADGHREAAKPWQSKESPDAGGLREAFQTVLVITYRGTPNPEYRHFQSQLILRAKRDFGVALNDSVGTLVAGCFHDGLLLYLRALNETLREGGTKRDTSRILEKMGGLKIQGVTGTLSINSENDRKTDFNLWAMRDVEGGEYQVCVLGGEVSATVVARYMESEKRIKRLGPIHWKKGGLPLDNLPCDFNKDDPSCGQDIRMGFLVSSSHVDPPS
ncbi:UNVERIFIED_CONTAM: hypothetical protein K2H54_021049 [Gekko kuhli]